MRFVLPVILISALWVPQFATAETSQTKCGTFVIEKSRSQWNSTLKTLDKALQESMTDKIDLIRENLEQQKVYTKNLQLLGFQFYEKEGEFIMETPSILELASKYNEMIVARVKDSNLNRSETDQIKEDEIIFFGVEFVDKDGKKPITLKIGEPIPKGYTMATPQLVTPGQSLYKSLASGRFPVVATKLIYHDIAHLTGYLESPEYMAAYARIAKYLVEEYNGIFYRKRFNLYKRVYNFNESFLLVSKQAASANLEFFDIPSGIEPKYGTQGYSYEQIYPQLESLSQEQLAEKAHLLFQLLPDLVVELGGGAIDPRHANLKAMVLSEGYNIVNVLKKGIEEDIALSRPSLRERLACFQSVLLLLSEVTPNHWAEVIMRSKYSESIVSEIFKTPATMPQQYFDLRHYNQGIFHTRYSW